MSCVAPIEGGGEIPVRYGPRHQRLTRVTQPLPDPSKPPDLWGDRRVSNPRQLEPQSSALPTELRPPSLRGSRTYWLGAGFQEVAYSGPAPWTRTPPVATTRGTTPSTRATPSRGSQSPWRPARQRTRSLRRGSGIRRRRSWGGTRRGG